MPPGAVRSRSRRCTSSRGRRSGSPAWRELLRITWPAMALVLVVDDEPDIRELVRINLEQAGHRVVTAADGDEALASVRHEPPDALFLDVRMPGTDGWAVLDELKAGSRRDLSEIPVFMVTAADEPEARLRGGIQGALQYITKPFDPRALVELLEQTLSPSAPSERELRRKVQAESLEALARYTLRRARWRRRCDSRCRTT